MILKYKRILIKLSGEGLKGGGEDIFDHQLISNVIKQIKYLHNLGIQIAIVIGAGNIFRGNQAHEFAISQTNAHYIGMIATTINALALKDYFNQEAIANQVYSALSVGSIIPQVNYEQAIQDLENNKIVIFAGGTGNPYATTDSAAALRATEISAQLIIKATQVNGVYDKDPNKYSDAIKFDTLSFDEAIDKKLHVMDLYAFELCRAQSINIAVCNLGSPEAIIEAGMGNTTGTLIA